MTWEAAAALVLGYVGQHLKALKGFPTIGVQGVLLAVGVLLYGLQTPPSMASLSEWLMAAVSWGLAVIGAASVSAASGLAPKTDSK